MLADTTTRRSMPILCLACCMTTCYLYDPNVHEEVHAASSQLHLNWEIGSENLPSHLQFHGMVSLTSEQRLVQTGRTMSNLFDGAFIFIRIYDRICYCVHPRVGYISSNLLFVRKPLVLFLWDKVSASFNTNRSTCINHYHVFFVGNPPAVRLWVVPQEFVHGDLGRTKPSMRSFLQGQVGGWGGRLSPRLKMIGPVQNGSKFQIR